MVHSVYRKKVADILIEIDAVRANISTGFKSQSGLAVPLWIDYAKLLSLPRIHKEVISYLVDHIVSSTDINAIDVVAGIAVGGVPHAALVAYQLDKPMVYTRVPALVAERSGHKDKKNHKARIIEGTLKKGQRVLVIDDHVISGRSVRYSIEAIRATGAEVVLCASISNVGFKQAHDIFASLKVPYITLTSFSDILEEAIAKNKLSSRQEKIIRNWEKDMLYFENWLEKTKHPDLHITHTYPIVINNVKFNSSSLSDTKFL